MAEEINAIIIIEMIGKPLEHLNKTLSSYIDRISGERGIKVIEKKISEPRKLEKSELFSTFAEIEINAEGLATLLNFIFTYMPSHIDIIKPESLRIGNYDINVLCNDVMNRLHAYDSITKNIIFERNALENQLRTHGITPVIAAKIPEKTAKKAAKKPVKKKKKI